MTGQVNATNRLPLENRNLLQEVSSITIEKQKLLETLAMERTRHKGLARALSMAYTRLLPMPQTAFSNSLGPWPYQE